MLGRDSLLHGELSSGAWKLLRGERSGMTAEGAAEQVSGISVSGISVSCGHVVAARAAL